MRDSQIAHDGLDPPRPFPGQQGCSISSTAILYRAAADELVLKEMDGLDVIFHRPSGLTHIVGTPVPEILDVMADGAALSVAAVRDRLAARFDLQQDDGEALAARLAEMAELGLVRRL